MKLHENAIQQWLGLSDSEYIDIVLDYGMSYCMHFTGGSREKSLQMRRSPYFWIWWLNQMDTINRIFYHEQKCEKNTPYILNLLYIVALEARIKCVYPSSFVTSRIACPQNTER